MPSKKDSSSEKKSSKKKVVDKKSKSKNTKDKSKDKKEKSKDKKKNKDEDKSDEEEGFESVIGSAKEMAEEYIKKGREIKNMIEKLNKIHKKDIKLGGKSKKKRDPNAKKFGIAAPTAVPKEIADFLKLEDPDELIPRTTITKMIYAYIDKHSLKQEDNKTIIDPDKKLTKLFKIEKDEELTIKTFGRFLARCYPKPKNPKKKKVAKSDDESASEKSDDSSIEESSGSDSD